MKAFYKSKTFWVNLLTGIAALGVMPEFVNLIGAHRVIVLLAITNLLLRLFSTSEQLTMTDTKDGDL